jgi:hypothetical protein
MDGERWSAGGVADEFYTAVVADADGGVVPNRAGISSEEGAQRTWMVIGASSRLGLSGQVLGLLIQLSLGATVAHTGASANNRSPEAQEW